MKGQGRADAESSFSKLDDRFGFLARMMALDPAGSP